MSAFNIISVLNCMQTSPPSWQLGCLSQPQQICLALVMETNSHVFMATRVVYLIHFLACLFTLCQVKAKIKLSNHLNVNIH